MNEPVSKAYIVPNDCPKDIELMAIWAQAYRDYSGELTNSQIKGALDWFASYIESALDE